MADKHILHMLSPLKHISPFDVNMALDAGYDSVTPYPGVTLEDVRGLVQDAIFSRPPKSGLRTAVFIGGRDAIGALDMLDAAKAAMVPPFAISVFADPAGSFTTAAALVARVERQLQRNFQRGLQKLRVVVFGATGVVGFASGVIAALEGAEVTLVGYDGVQRVARMAEELNERFSVALQAADGSTEALKAKLLGDAEAAFCCGRAGVMILSDALLRGAAGLRIVADVNTVPPPGVEGLDAMADGTALPGTAAIGIGALAIGQTKYQTEIGLFRQMIEASKPVNLNFREAFALARSLSG